MLNINEFCSRTGFTFVTSEIGFGRPCVGILNPKTECYVAYTVYDGDYNVLSNHSVAAAEAPEHAYHKGSYLVVLTSDIGVSEATTQLDIWLEKILKSGFKVIDYHEKNGITNLLAGKALVTQKAITDEEKNGNT